VEPELISELDHVLKFFFTTNIAGGDLGIGKNLDLELQ